MVVNDVELDLRIAFVPRFIVLTEQCIDIITNLTRDFTFHFSHRLFRLLRCVRAVRSARCER